VRDNQDVGRHGEKEAAAFLEHNGYRIIARNYKTRLGEIDIVASDQDTICFVEVKTRLSEKFGSPLEAVSVFKQRQIAKTALLYLKEHKLLERRARFDVVSVKFISDTPKIDLIRNAFELSQHFSY